MTGAVLARTLSRFEHQVSAAYKEMAMMSNSEDWRPPHSCQAPEGSTRSPKL